MQLIFIKKIGFNIKNFSYFTFFYEYFFLKYSGLCDELKLDIIQHMNIHNKRVWDPKDAALCLYTGMTQIDLHVQHKALYISM